MGLHWQELVVILIIVLVLFGPRRLPEIGRSLGNGIREFRDSMSGRQPQTVEAHEEASPELPRAAIPVEAAPDDSPVETRK